MLNFIKLAPVVAELFHADRRTDMTKLVVTFPKFSNASRKPIILRNIFSIFFWGGGSCDGYCTFNKGAHRERKKTCFRFSVPLIILS